MTDLLNPADGPLPALYLSHGAPLFITLGAGDDPGRPVRTTIDGYLMGFAKRSLQTAG